jgi:branched-chain amino acid transport system substrate-binding protein
MIVHHKILLGLMAGLCINTAVACLAAAAERPIKIEAFGALTGPVKSFGINSRAALGAATERINRSGGVKLGDGATGRFSISYSDDHCTPDSGIAIVRRAAASDALLALGPSCSSVAEPLYATLPPRVESAGEEDPIPVFTDGATKANLARISEWAFRNAPNEGDMYRELWAWVHAHHPELRTVYGGEEHDFAHSHSTWDNIMSKGAEAAGFRLVGGAGWSIADAHFAEAVEKIRTANADILVISAHAPTTCGALTELARQHVRPKLLVGLTSASTPETMQLCPAEAEGLLIPTSFIATTPETVKEADEVAEHGGIADLHSMAAWEILYAVKQVIEQKGISAASQEVSADRRKLRDGLADLKVMQGVFGTITRTPDRESLKPFVLVQARHGKWEVVHAPTHDGSRSGR